MNTSLNTSELSGLTEQLAKANSNFHKTYPGVQIDRQAVHTVYGGAHLYKPGIGAKLGDLALAHLTEYAPTFVDLARALDFTGSNALPDGLDEIKNLQQTIHTNPAFAKKLNPAAWLAQTIYQRVQQKLKTEAVEDQRIDFEDGYGSRINEEEDGHAVSAAEAMAEGLKQETLPSFNGIRIKSLTEETKARALRTLDLFLTHTATLTGASLPEYFVITLPKVTSAEQVSVLADCLDLLEKKNGFKAGSIKIELMIEMIQSIFRSDGKNNIPALVQAGRGRVSSAILGTYDYTASCNIASTHQDHMHPSADFARQMMQASLTGTPVTLCDGITNVMPIAPHKKSDTPLSHTQLKENMATVHGAWKIHFDNILHSLKLGFYQGWDLNPAQLPIRYAAVYYFFLTGVDATTSRLKTFIDKAAQASLVGNVFDDAASAQGLLNFFISGISCGALTEEEALITGISLEELKGRSFQKIIENRVRSQVSNS